MLENLENVITYISDLTKIVVRKLNLFEYIKKSNQATQTKALVDTRIASDDYTVLPLNFFLHLTNLESQVLCQMATAEACRGQ